MTLNICYQIYSLLLALVCINNHWRLSYREEFLENIFYILFSSLLFIFCMFRPLGVGLDDEGYFKWIYDSICPAFSCGKLIQGERDQAWYSTLGIIKSIITEPRSILWFAGGALLAKLIVIYYTCRNKCLALLLYSSMFYIIHDITALRLTVAISAYVLGIFLLVKERVSMGVISISVAGLFHKQAYLAPLVFIGKIIPNRIGLTRLLIVLPFVLLSFKIYPTAYLVSSTLKMIQLDIALKILSGFDPTYFQAIIDSSNGAFSDIRLWPVVVPPTLLFACLTMQGLFLQNSNLYRYTSASLIIASWLLWGYASIPHMQLRFWHFFLVPIVFIAGNMKATRINISLCLILSGMYVAKYTIANDLLNDQNSVLINETIGGKAIIYPTGIFCGSDCGYNITSGTQAVIEAIPDDGYIFSRWNGACDLPMARCQLIINTNMKVEAIFDPISR